ncbi:MAG: pur operon repressor, partial [Streptococcus suis]
RSVANYKSLLAVTDINVKENRVDVELGNIFE